MAEAKKRRDDDYDSEDEEFDGEDETEEEDDEEPESEESDQDEDEKPRKRSGRTRAKKKSASQTKRKKSDSTSRSHRADGEITAQKAASEAMKQLAELTSHCALGATAIKPGEDGWSVEIEVLEERRIPSTADLLSLYAIELDTKGQLVSYHRIKRYARNRTDGSGGC